MLNPLNLLFDYLSQAGMLREQPLNKILQAYQEESRLVAVIDDLEKDLRTRLRIFPTLRANEEFTISLEAAILSLRGWLLAFSAAALILLSLSISLKYQNQSVVGLEEVLTYNVDSAHRDSILFSDEVDYGH